MEEIKRSILTTHELAIGYESKVIASDLNLVLNSNEMVCLLGQNGVGKSTLIRTIANLQPVLNGAVLINDNQIDRLNKFELASTIGIVTTEKIGALNLTVRELVSLGRYPYTNWLGKLTKADLDKVDDAISLCKINYLEDQKMANLSDGQKQKAMIARVLAQDTRIIILDEPTAHLDMINRAEVMKLLSDIKSTHNKAILISTHELPLSLQFADRLWLMNYNQPIIEGIPEELVLTGALNDIFFHESFDIDVATGKVVLQTDNRIMVGLQGESDVLFWVKAALERNLIGVINEAEYNFTVKMKNHTMHWFCNGKESNASGMGIESMIKFIESLNAA